MVHLLQGLYCAAAADATSPLTLYPVPHLTVTAATVRTGHITDVEGYKQTSINLMCGVSALNAICVVYSYCMYHCLAAWQLFFDVFGHSSKAASVLAWIQHGVPLESIHPLSAQQQLHPRFKERVQLVERLLDKPIGVGHITSFLDCTHPCQVPFANRVSCTYYQQFVLERRDEPLHTGAFVECVTV